VDRINQDEIQRRVHAKASHRLAGGLFVMAAFYGIGHVIAGPVFGSVLAFFGAMAAAWLVLDVLRGAPV
jgi:hypothetical protein